MTEIGLELRAAALSLLGGAGADEKASRAIADVLERAADKIEDLHQTIAHARINTGRAYQRLGGVIGGKIMTEQKRGER